MLTKVIEAYNVDHMVLLACKDCCSNNDVATL